MEKPTVLVGRTGRVAVHESYDLAPDAGIKPSATSLKPVTVCIGITSDAVRSNSPLSKNVSSTPVMHSSWIQRLKPSSHRPAAKVEPLIFTKKDSFVCTHFTKDYSSCGRGLKKFTHHTRSASWPPHSSESNAGKQLDVEEAACDSLEEHYNTAAISSDFNHQNACVQSKNASQSSGAGSRTGSQQDCRKHFHPPEGFVSCAQLFSEDRDRRKPESCFGQQFQDHINKESESKSMAPFEQGKLHCRSEKEKSINWTYFDGSFPIISEFVSAPPLPVSVGGAGYSCGASADADASYCYAKPLTFGVSHGKEIYQSGFGEFDCRGRNVAEKLDKLNLILPCKEEAVQNSLSMGFKDAVDLNIPQSTENSVLFKGAAGKAYLRSRFSTKRPDDPHLSNSNFQRSGACTREDTTTQNSLVGAIGASRSKEYNLVTSQSPHSGEGVQASRLPVSIRSLDEDAARVRIREKSMGDYLKSWVRLLEEHDHGRSINSGHSKACLQPDLATGHYYEEFCQQSSTANQNVNSSKSHKLVNLEKDTGSCDSDPQSIFLSKFSGPRIRSRQLIASSDYLSNFVADCLEVPQEQDLYSHEGASGRVDLQPHNENSGFHRRFLDEGSSPSSMHPVNLSLNVINNEPSRKEWNTHSGWLQRWLSVEKSSSPSGKSLALYKNQTVGSVQTAKFPKSCFANAQCTIGSSHQDINCCERNLSVSGGSDRYSGTHLNYGSAPSTGSRPASQNFAAFRCGYIRGSIEAMAIVGNLAGKQHPTSLQNRGFNCLPGPKTWGDVTFSEEGKDADEDQVRFVD